MARRAGLIVSLVRYTDGGRERSVLYRGSVAEMFVPYMDPDEGWSFRTFMDVGEYGLGLLSSPLAPGIDCPADAALFDATLPDDHGRPVLGKSVICLFEHDTAAPAWRHYEAVNGRYQGQAAVELVLRTIPSIGNYNYVIDWVLTPTGVIRIDVGSTGIDQVKGVAASTMRDPPAPADTAYGDLVARQSGRDQPRPFLLIPARPRYRRHGKYAVAREAGAATSAGNNRPPQPVAGVGGDHRDRGTARRPT